MRFNQAALAIATFATISSAVTLDRLQSRDTGLEITLEKVENSVVKATVKNVGTKALNLMKAGSIFDDAPVEKLNVMSEGGSVEFEGILRRVKLTDLQEDAFHLLEAGATYETTIDAAAVHTLSTAKYSVSAEGALPYAEAGSTQLSGNAVYYKSNTLELDIDGEAAKLTKKAIPTLSERTVLQSGCSTAQRTATTNALANCVSLSRQAATQASSGSASKFSEYFKTSSRSSVSSRFTTVANQCASTTSGSTRYYCTDPYGYCSSNTLAYTLPSQNLIVNCPIYYSAIPALTRSCHAQDQATTTLHEMTHAQSIAGTQDNAYGYSASVALSASQAFNNADTYALYANAIYAGC